MECNSCASKSHGPVRHTGTEAHWCSNEPPKLNPWPWELHPSQLRQAVGVLPEPALLSIGFNLCASQLSPHPHWEAKIYPLVVILHLTWSIFFSLLLASWNRSNEQFSAHRSTDHRCKSLTLKFSESLLLQQHFKKLQEMGWESWEWPSVLYRGMQQLQAHQNPIYLSWLWLTTDSSSKRKMHYLSCPGILTVQLQVENKVCRQVQKHSRNQRR